jgi:hypothetical protein
MLCDNQSVVETEIHSKAICDAGNTLQSLCIPQILGGSSHLEGITGKWSIIE